ncbi:motility protein A [Bordetella petrii]|uniref:motility protein A n=1 Tax=Bordetella petrii TaxID=94624 RepID=UPI001A9657A1|nr:MotA/TolQ/ExbB proton channel family protein [Bordetella petrii]MBO1110567.1 MotA/TolQ/ExbB proton channel family protein [Bordetella petrii]
MNPSTLIGIVVAVATLATALAFSATDLALYINLPGLVVVLGGTCAALFISYPLREVVRVFALVRTVFRSEQLDSRRDIDELVAMAQLWMNDDVHKVEQALHKVANPFLRTGVQLVIDHTPEDQIIELLQWRIARLRAREHAEAQMFRIMAGFAPAFGMLGTLVGLINLMTVLGSGDMVVIGQQLAVALMTTFYGILLANLVCKPIAVKLERRTEQRLMLMNMVLQGISMMCARRGPAVVRETLNSFMMHFEDEVYDGGPAAKPAKPAKPAKAKAAAGPAGAAKGGKAAPAASLARTAAARP